MTRAKNGRPARGTNGTADRNRIHRQSTETPAPVDMREDGVIVLGPLPPIDHPGHPVSDWNLYGRPPAAPWGSYLDTSLLPLPPGGKGPLGYAMDAIAEYRQSRGAQR